MVSEFSEDVVNDAFDYFNFYNGISMVKAFDGYYEVCEFAAPYNNKQIAHLYFNHLEIFENFQYYFKEQAEHLIERASKHRLMHYASCSCHSCQLAERVFPASLKPKYFRFRHNSRYVKVTRGELKCLIGLLKWHTAKQAASKLGLSARTIESHIFNLKGKFGVGSQSQLTRILKNNYHRWALL